MRQASLILSSRGFRPDGTAGFCSFNTAFGADRTITAPGAWFVLHTRSRQEKTVANALRALRCAYFLPTERRIRHYGRRKCLVDAVLFPGYVFLRGSIEQAYAANQTRRLARIIAVADQQQLHCELWNVYAALRRGAALSRCACLKEGVWVEVRSGPFRGLQGVIERVKKRNRLVIQVNMLGQAASIEVDGDLLEPIDEPWLPRMAQSR